MALSSFVRALYETSSLALGRLVTKDGKEPLVVALAPSVDVDCECLIELTVPFAEDIRSYQFPPLDHVITVTGRVLTEHRLLADDALCSAMDAYVDSMDLDSFGTDEDG